MYVAITRARRRLYLSHSQTRLLHGQTRYNLRSRFFDELPEEALKWLTPKQSGFGHFAGSGAGGGARSSSGGFGGFSSSGYSGGSGYGGSGSPAPAPVPQRAAPSHGLRSGMQVFHNKFGEGTVTALEGSGDDARAQVKFNRHGIKWLALSVAKLTPVE